MEINKLLTTTNYNKATNRKIEYIVIHYVGAEGGDPLVFVRVDHHARDSVWLIDRD